MGSQGQRQYVTTLNRTAAIWLSSGTARFNHYVSSVTIQRNRLLKRAERSLKKLALTGIRYEYKV